MSAGVGAWVRVQAMAAAREVAGGLHATARARVTVVGLGVTVRARPRTHASGGGRDEGDVDGRGGGEGTGERYVAGRRRLPGPCMS